MLDLIPHFNFQDVVLAPWQGGFSAEQPASPMAFWQVLMGFMVASACGLVGNYLMLRRMALVGDAISHSVLPGIVIGYFFTRNPDSPWLVLGAAASGRAAGIRHVLVEHAVDHQR